MSNTPRRSPSGKTLDVATVANSGLMTASQVKTLINTEDELHFGSLESSYEKMVDAILSAAPTKIYNIYLGDSITDTTTVSTIPGLLPGLPALTAAGAASGFGIKTDATTGRKCCYSTTSADRALILSAGTFKDVLVVYRNYGASAPAASNSFLCSFTTGIYPLQLNSGKDQWETTSAGNPTHYLDGVLNNSLCNDERPHVYEGVISGNVATGLKIGGFNGFNFSIQGEIFAVIPCIDVLTSNERTLITNALLNGFNIKKPTGFFLDGNSIVQGIPSMVNWVRNVVIPNVVTWNIATAGNTLDDVISSLPAGLASKDYNGLNLIYFMYEDVVSLYTGIDSAETIIEKNWKIASMARSAGAKVILSTCMPANTTLDATAEAKRLVVNAAKRAQWQDHCEALIDWAAIPPFNNSNNSIFTDHLHLTDYGYYLFGAEVRKTALALINS